ncbi:MAG: methyltransferase domain-containing protein [Anaerolineales bacterium]
MNSTSVITSRREGQKESTIEEIRAYWNEHIHDLEIATHPVGTLAFFKELEEYRFDKLRYLLKVVDFSSYAGKELLEVGCGVGIDLARFAQAGAIVTGIDLAENSVALAQKYFEHLGLKASFQIMNGELVDFGDGSFDVVYAHGVLQYTPNPQKMIDEICRVLRPGGEAVLMVYNRYSWLNLLSAIMKVDLEHADAPALRKYSIGQFKDMLKPFSSAKIFTERFPVRTRLHHGLKAQVYNQVFVGAFNRLPRTLIRPFGWHILAFAYK